MPMRAHVSYFQEGCGMLIILLSQNVRNYYLHPNASIVDKFQEERRADFTCKSGMQD